MIRTLPSNTGARALTSTYVLRTHGWLMLWLHRGRHTSARRGRAGRPVPGPGGRVNRQAGVGAKGAGPTHSRNLNFPATANRICHTPKRLQTSGLSLDMPRKLSATFLGAMHD